ncbi:IFIT5: Interferon-induced protein with tetratricopeptide repeats 5 [Crotalus adamanteus]|uniref:IFIT5: Interferon-induced protein with tetratricopeptide repeats 5 n=1 Tax=Crotalus adamanteus TaxID=8729 RepID=A0AAW1BFL0_CROAD
MNLDLLSQEGLKEILQQFECHFTWMLQKEHIHPDELEERIAEQIQFLINKSKIRNYNLLAYVKFLNNKKEEALENLQKAEETVPILGMLKRKAWLHGATMPGCTTTWAILLNPKPM